MLTAPILGPAPGDVGATASELADVRAAVGRPVPRTLLEYLALVGGETSGFRIRQLELADAHRVEPLAWADATTPELFVAHEIASTHRHARGAPVAFDRRFVCTGAISGAGVLVGLLGPGDDPPVVLASSIDAAARGEVSLLGGRFSSWLDGLLLPEALHIDPVDDPRAGRALVDFVAGSTSAPPDELVARCIAAFGGVVGADRDAVVADLIDEALRGHPWLVLARRPGRRHRVVVAAARSRLRGVLDLVVGTAIAEGTDGWIEDHGGVFGAGVTSFDVAWAALDDAASEGGLDDMGRRLRDGSIAAAVARLR